jgi:branched-chain amino acid transport system permease protein
MYARVRSAALAGPWVAVAGAVILVVLPLAGVGPYWQRQIMLIGVYTLMCSGLNLSFGYAGEMALGQVGIFAAGAYLTAILYNHGITDIFLAILASILLAALVGLLSGIPGLRLSHWSLAIVSFFLILLIPSLTQILQTQTGGLLGLPGIIGPTLFGQAVSNTGFYVITVIVTAVWMLVFRNMIASPFGSSLRVLGESSTLTESLGCSAFRLKVSAYVLGALPAGIAGSLFAYLTGFVSPDSFTMDVLIAVLAATVVGGADSVWGAPLGAALLVLGPLQASSFQEYSIAVYGVFLLVVGVLFSGGILGLVRAAGRQLSRRLATGPAGQGDSPEPADGPEPAVTPASLPIPGERLTVSGVTKSFAGLQALAGVELTAQAGAITAIIGANGAGKTTLLNTISGFLAADAGEVRLGDRLLTGSKPYKVARLGVGRTFQTPQIPKSMTVLQVVESGRLGKSSARLLASILRLPGFYLARHHNRAAALAALSFAGLVHLAGAEAGSLPLGTRRLLEVARCVAGAPNVLLLDEPAAGLDDDSLRDLGSLMRQTRAAGGTVVIVEHNVPFIMGLADHVFVMELGQVIAAGPPETVRTDERVIDSYLGRRHRNGSQLTPSPRPVQAAVTNSQKDPMA